MSVHPDFRQDLRRALGLLALLAIGLALTLAWPATSRERGVDGYEALHLAMETVAVVIASLVFAVGWHAHARALPGNIVLLACTFLGVALLDFSHALSYTGMPRYVTPADPEKAIHFWLAARLLAALGLLAAAARPWRPLAEPRVRYQLLGAVLLAVALAHGVFLYMPEVLPRTFVPGSGLTPLKVGAEYLLIVLYAAAALLFWRHMLRPRRFNAPALFAAACAMAASEFFFTLYDQVTDVYNLMGHLYKLAAYLFLYRAVFVETVEHPYQRLQEAQTRLRSTLQTVPDLLWLKDVRGVYLDCNPAFERFIGAPREAVVGKTDEDFVSAAQAEFFRLNDRLAMEADRPRINEEWLSFAADGYRGLFETVKAPMRDAQGRLVGVLGIARDITAARQSQAALATNEERLRQATRVAQIGIFDHDHSVDAIYWSPEQRVIYGMSADESITLQGFLARLHPDDRPRIAQAVQRAHDPSGDGHFDVEHRIVRPDGVVRHLSTRSRTLFDGEGAQRRAVRTVGAVLDITERVEVDRGLRMRDEALRTAFNAVAMSDMDGRLTFVNDAFVRLWGLSDEGEALGRGADEFWAQPERAQAMMTALSARPEGGLKAEMEARRADGSRFDVAVWASIALGPGGEPVGLLASFLDITERKHAQAELQRLNATLEARVEARTRELELRNQELVRAEKLAALGALVAGVAHELNTPIGNAVMVASTLSGRQREFEAGMAGGLRLAALENFLATTREVTEVLERNLQRAAELIGSFKQIAIDQASYQRRTFEFAEVVQEIAVALRPTLRRNGVVLEHETAPALALDSYPGPLGQVLINLVNNAVVHAFACQGAGSVRITAQPVGDDRLRITVADNGCGIAPEHLPQLFDPFFTTRLGQGGSGLGLHIVFTLVTGLLGGRIDVQSTLGAGTTFCIELPRVAPAAASPELAAG